MTDTLEHRPPEISPSAYGRHCVGCGAPINGGLYCPACREEILNGSAPARAAPYRDAALGFIAMGLTAAAVREYASDALYVSRAARANRCSAQKAYSELLLIADAISTLEDQGMTREQASLLVPDDLTAA